MRRSGHRSRLLPAQLALLAAIFLLLLSHAGYEQTIRTKLAQFFSSSTVAERALALELGLETDGQPVASAATPAETASESAYIAESPPPDAPTLFIPDESATVSVNNETAFEIDVSDALAHPYALRVDQDGPQVLILHTHGSESYTADAAFPYTPTEFERTTDTRFNVVRVGDALQQLLEEEGIQTLHCTELFDTPAYNGSYDRALASIEEIIAEHPSIRVIIDLHRDSILADDGTAYRTACTIGGQSAAQAMLVVGTNAGGLFHDDWRTNLNVAINLQYALNQAYPGLMRPVNLRTQRFNGHVCPGSMLVEVGSSGNTMTEALHTIQLFGSVLAKQLNGA